MLIFLNGILSLNNVEASFWYRLFINFTEVLWDVMSWILYYHNDRIVQDVYLVTRGAGTTKSMKIKPQQILKILKRLILNCSLSWTELKEKHEGNNM